MINNTKKGGLSVLLHLDFSLDTPIYQQIRNEIVRGIAAGSLVPGQQLPTIRSLAETLGVNMMTVNKAYALLKQEGYLKADRRSGTVVAGRTGPLTGDLRSALELAAAQARASGVPLQEVLDVCRDVYEPDERGQG